MSLNFWRILTNWDVNFEDWGCLGSYQGKFEDFLYQVKIRVQTLKLFPALVSWLLKPSRGEPDMSKSFLRFSNMLHPSIKLFYHSPLIFWTMYWKPCMYSFLIPLTILRNGDFKDILLNRLSVGNNIFAKFLLINCHEPDEIYERVCEKEILLFLKEL